MNQKNKTFVKIDPSVYFKNLDLSPSPLKKVMEWRGLFPEKMLSDAASKALQHSMSDFTVTRGTYYSGPGCRCWFPAEDDSKKRQRPASYGRRGYSVFDSMHYGKIMTTISDAPDKVNDSWSDASFSCACEYGKKGMRCVHEAALLLQWEKAYGTQEPFVILENNRAFSARQEKIRRAKEMQRRAALQEEKGMNLIPAISCFTDRVKKSGLVFFDLEKALEGRLTTPYFAERMKEVLKNNVSAARSSFYYKPITLEKDRYGNRSIVCSIRLDDDPVTASISARLARGTFLCLDDLVTDQASEFDGYFPDEEDIDDIDGTGGDMSHMTADVLDEYLLTAVRMIWDFVDQQDTEGLTDNNAENFFRSLEKAQTTTVEESVLPAPPKRRTLRLEPRIIIEEGEARLTFKVSRAGGRGLIQRNIAQLIGAYRQEEEFGLSKKEIVDFSSEDFLEESMPLVQFVIRRVGEVSAVNAKLSQKSRYGYASPSLNVNSLLELSGSLLDNFYDVTEGLGCEYQDKTNGIKDTVIQIGHTSLKFRLTLEPLRDARDTFAGVAVSGYIPVMIKGSTHKYTLNDHALSRISKEEESTLAPFWSVADAAGYFRFQVGFDKLQEFYYRVLPVLLSSPCVELDDQCGDEARQYLSPEPDFTFYLDYEAGTLYCKCRVSYDGQNFFLTSETQGSGKDHVRRDEVLADSAGSSPDIAVKRDLEQEQRIRRLLHKHFTNFDNRTLRYRSQMDDDQMFSFLQSGIAQLSRYGTVQGTDAFLRQRIRPVPQITVGVSVSSNLMDFTVTSRELSGSELLEILESYRIRKRYHKLSSGEFIDLAQPQQLDEMQALVSDLDITAADAIRGRIHLPVYRAIYLDKLLEEHDALASSRDRTFRNLARNFKNVRDADYEVPPELQDTLRPYQAHGFKWLQTLESNGFGGILADEMGLGKTLQMITLLLYDKNRRTSKDDALQSLIVCPASLVFNWQEEFGRFAPSMRTAVLAGTPAARKKMLQSSDTDVFITSYDLLRKDITLFQEKLFHVCVLDEAQYIKNSRAAVTKAVKAVKSSHRFALTGTPIENRLAELWSIFDFLMPGFLFSYTDFEKRFETPISKQKDEQITAKLKKMTGPFILRRRKEEVLQDLPAKLEEVRYARVCGEQQKLYDAQVMRMKGMISGGFAGGEEKIRIFAELTRIRQICCDPSLVFENYTGESAKREACMDTIRSAIDGGHRMLVFSQFTSMLSLLEADLKKEGIDYYLITGATPKEKRVAMVHAFNEGTTPVFLISLKAGGTGLNLTGADVVIHYDPWWNLAAQNQATDRAHRIGQTRQVTVYRLILKDTIEERIMELQDAKKDLAEAIIEGETSSLMSMSGEELLALLG